MGAIAEWHPCAIAEWHPCAIAEWHPCAIVQWHLKGSNEALAHAVEHVPFDLYEAALLQILQGRPNAPGR
jgi:hypothetical protein